MLEGFESGINTPPVVENKFEKTKPFDLGFYITDHSPDTEQTGNPEQLKALYADILKDGVTSVRYDWRWNNIQPAQAGYKTDSLDRYTDAIGIMKEVGLEPPTVILSSIPAWALELYKTDKETFFSEYQKYVEEVKERLIVAATETGQLVSRVQILNELNNTVYTPIVQEDIPRLCQITREILTGYNPDIKLMGTLFVGNLPEVAAKATFGLAKLGTPIMKYLDENKAVLDNFDVLAVDYYPGMYHVPLGAVLENNKDLFSQLGLLKEAMEKIASWGKEYELGEVGMQTNLPSIGPKQNEHRQRYFFDVFFREFKHLLLDFERRGIQLPERVGLYEAVDEAAPTLLRKIIRTVTPFPEHDLGMRKSDMNRKEIGKGIRHATEEERVGTESQLSKIIKYLNTPVRRSADEIIDQRNKEIISLATELAAQSEGFSFPDIDYGSYLRIKADEEKYPGYTLPIDAFIVRSHTQRIKVVFGKHPESGNVFILPMDSNDIESDGIHPRHLQITDPMDDNLKKLILADRARNK